ncbi:S-methyl-5'-thioadenosine phosphorylase [Sphingosinicella microcystinivorans]|uniref:S-methyl-5'-thioadenosine phosphorylase n=1 Tax=Sphingosinicella microcystinivorans TaxID=335406 RepID=UPI0022F3B409|nr:S-methyl-5'-thioadenosine phosphorylase [Sphingosinicella microcystinivorans]WBX85877.1 S-methyl-5'-thioadenosine phosphorylase [Sphingosinicella microcystinivorans]
MGGRLGIIGGSGLYALGSLADVEWRAVDTPFGRPSDDLLFGRLGQADLVFLPRHGRGHRLTPSEVPYRANIAALKAAGCTHVLSLSACGSFREALSPGTFVLVDQFVDRTRGRVKSFFGDGIVAHVSLADPVCGPLGARVADAAKALGIPFVSGGTYLVMEGPQFSTRAESRAYVAAGFDVIGMTNMPEAALAREAELCYASVAMVTDYDSWRPAEEGANVAEILEVMHGNGANARALVAAVAAAWPAGPAACPQGCDHALDHAIITDPALWPPPTVEKLRGIAGRVLA